MNLYARCILNIKKTDAKKYVLALKWLGLTHKVMIHFARVDCYNQ
jgi:hypothetical protein